MILPRLNMINPILKTYLDSLDSDSLRYCPMYMMICNTNCPYEYLDFFCHHISFTDSDVQTAKDIFRSGLKRIQSNKIPVDDAEIQHLNSIIKIHNGTMLTSHITRWMCAHDIFIKS
jgi:hypothetical protein